MHTLLTLVLLAAPAEGGARSKSAQDLARAQAEAAEILAALVRIDTSNPPGDETRAAEHLKARLDAEGIPSRIFEAASGRGNFVARLRGSGKKRPLLLMGHLDVVGVERQHWTVDPFGAVIEDGYLYGRGASDDKGMVAANVAVFLRLYRSKLPLDRDVILLAEAGEEGTSEFGIDYLVDKHWAEIDCEYALNEGGEFTLRDGRLLFAGVSTTEKVPRGLKLVARGTSGHGSMPRPDNAITHLAAALAKLGAWQPPMRLNDTTRAFFTRLALLSPPGEARLYTHLEDPAVQETLRTGHLRFNSMLRTSVVPTLVKGGFRSNVIPAEAEATLDVRALPDEDMEVFAKTLTALIGDPAVRIVPETRTWVRPAAPSSSLTSDMFRALERAQQKVFPESATLPILQTGATDSAQLRARGVQAYGLSIPKSEEDTRRVHGNDERVSLESLGRFVDYLDAAVTGIAAAR